jgi:hypothetical protein
LAHEYDQVRVSDKGRGIDPIPSLTSNQYKPNTLVA